MSLYDETCATIRLFMGMTYFLVLHYNTITPVSVSIKKCFVIIRPRNCRSVLLVATVSDLAITTFKRF
jgi:hypothetical protein